MNVGLRSVFGHWQKPHPVLLEKDSTFQLLHAFLMRMGAFDIFHRNGRSLGQHLASTYLILQSLGCNRTLCLAGGLHSVYGTNKFRDQLLPIDRSSEIVELFGPEVERLVHLFCTFNRPRGLETGVGENWRTEQPMSLKADDLRQLRILEAVNLREQGYSLDPYPYLFGYGSALSRSPKHGLWGVFSVCNRKLHQIIFKRKNCRYVFT